MSWKYRQTMKKASEALEAGDFLGAEEALNAVLSESGEPIEALIHRSYAKLCRGAYPEAEADAKRATELRPESGFSFLLLGQSQVGQNNLMAAHASLTTAVNLERDNGQALFHLGQVCARLNRKMEAADHFESALGLERDYVMSQWMAEFFSRG